MFLAWSSKDVFVERTTAGLNKEEVGDAVAACICQFPIHDFEAAGVSHDNLKKACRIFIDKTIRLWGGGHCAAMLQVGGNELPAVVVSHFVCI